MVTAEVIKGEAGYPCLKIDPCTGLIVLFIEHDSGFVVATGDDEYPIGDSSEKWGEDSFEPFTGSVTLRNS